MAGAEFPPQHIPGWNPVSGLGTQRISIFADRAFQCDEMNYRDASIRGIGDFACGDQLTQRERGRTDSPARSIFAMQSIAV